MMGGMKKRHFCVLGLVAALLGGCQSSIRPLRPIERVEMWQAADGTLHPLASTRPAGGGIGGLPDAALAMVPATMSGAEASTEPSTASTQTAATQDPTTENATTQVAAGEGASTQVASTQTAATEPATGPATGPAGQVVVRQIDPNQTARFVYKASYDNVWRQAVEILHKMGFAIDRQDYRDGVLVTQALPSAQIVEFWRPQRVNVKDSLENTLHDQRRTIRLTITAVPGKANFYEIAAQVLVERGTNPTEEIGGPIFVEGSGFGRNSVALRSDYVPAEGDLPRWNVIGHDVDMEKKVLDKLFERI
jgi:hypothetical protein